MPWVCAGMSRGQLLWVTWSRRAPRPAERGDLQGVDRLLGNPFH
jgi:hypothetical protein